MPQQVKPDMFTRALDRARCRGDNVIEIFGVVLVEPLFSFFFRALPCVGELQKKTLGPKMAVFRSYSPIPGGRNV